MKQKIRLHGNREVIYDSDHWDLLQNFHEQAAMIMAPFHEKGIKMLVYGSVARGSVHKDSDIDILITRPIPSFQVELIIDTLTDSLTLTLLEKKIIQATPNDIVKAHYVFDSNITITLLLTDFSTMPLEFYRFGGALTYSEIAEGLNSEKNKLTRVPGVDKQLLIIQPNELGHTEQPLEDFQYTAAKILGISQQMIDQRLRVLTRRDKVGRTGVYLDEQIPLSSNVEEELRRLARTNSILRRRLNF